MHCHYLNAVFGVGGWKLREHGSVKHFKMSCPQLFSSNSLYLRQEVLAHQESVLATEARLRMEGVEFKEEWQDEDFPR